MFSRLHRLDYAVSSVCYRAEPSASHVYSLMVERIDRQVCGVHYASQHASIGNADHVCRFVFRSLLRVLDICRDMLTHMSSERNGHCLHAAADAEHRHVHAVCHEAERQFVVVAQAVDGAELCYRLFAHPQRVMVSAPGEYHSIYIHELLAHENGIVYRWHQHGYTTSPMHLFHVFLPDEEVLASGICRYAYYRHARMAVVCA